MRLSTERDRDEARGVEVLHAALDAGITLFDTADAYCWDDTETGHNERLIARALATWTGPSAALGAGDRSPIVVATKGGLTRPNGRWVPNGRAVHLRAAAEASLRTLGVSRISLYQLHAVDPRTPLSTSVRALSLLQRDGLVEHIGICNVTVGQIEEARRIADIAAVQVELSLWNDANVLSGVAEYCDRHGIRLIAYRPLGGPTRARRAGKDRALAEVAARHGATPQEIALARLMDLSSVVTPIPGATRVETAISIARVPAIQLTDEDHVAFGVARGFQPRDRSPERAALRPLREGEIVLIMGLPGAGKTTFAQTLVADGFARLNRDEAGGTLRDQMSSLSGLVEGGRTRIVLDNTYVSRKSRAPVVAWASAAGLPVRCIWLSTSVGQAQVNAVSRMLSTYGRLLGPDEMRQITKTDVNAFGPAVQFRYQRELEPPDASESFSRIDVVPFERAIDPSLTNQAVIVWCDDVLVRSRTGERAPVSADDVQLIDGRADVLRRYRDEGWRLLAMSWRPEVEEERITREEADAGFARMRELLGLEIDVEYCPHGGGPPTCWCRKPLPGLGVVFIRKYLLDPSQCIYVGAGAQDPGFARRLGFQYRAASDFFGQPD